MTLSIASIRTHSPRSLRRSRAVLVGLVCLLGAAGCGSGSGSGSNDGTPNVSDLVATGAQAGTMPVDDAVSGGALVQGGADALAGRWEQCGGLANTYVFDAGRFEQYISYHDTPDCSGEPLRDEGLVSPDEVFVSGSYRLIGAVTTEEGLQALAIDMTGETLFGAPVFESVQVTRYGLVYTGTPGQLVFARDAGFTADERPNALDFERPFLAK